MERDGGSRAWVLNPVRARTCAYLVCAWNAYGEHAESTAARGHREAFLVAPISGIERDADEPERFIVRFNEFSRYSKPNAWPLPRRNPVSYTTLGDLEIDVSRLTFSPIASSGGTAATPAMKGSPGEGALLPLTIAAAKRGLALQFGVDPDAVEITIRG